MRDRADVVAALQEAGLDVPRQGNSYVTAHDPETGKRWRAACREAVKRVRELWGADV